MLFGFYAVLDELQEHPILQQIGKQWSFQPLKLWNFKSKISATTIKCHCVPSILPGSKFSQLLPDALECRSTSGATNFNELEKIEASVTSAKFHNQWNVPNAEWNGKSTRWVHACLACPYLIFSTLPKHFYNTFCKVCYFLAVLCDSLTNDIHLSSMFSQCVGKFVEYGPCLLMFALVWRANWLNVMCWYSRYTLRILKVIASKSRLANNQGNRKSGKKLMVYNVFAFCMENGDMNTRGLFTCYTSVSEQHFILKNENKSVRYLSSVPKTNDKSQFSACANKFS